MQYRRLNEDEMIIYFSTRDMNEYNIDFSIFLSGDNQSEAQETIFRFLEKIEGGLDFAKEGQLSIQMLPPKHREGAILCLRKFSADMEHPQAMVDELMNMLQVGPDAFKERMDQIFSVVDELLEEYDKEERQRIASRVPRLIAQTKDVLNLMQISALKSKWNMISQTLYYNDGLYTLVSEYPKGTPDSVINEDRVFLNEGLTTILKDARDCEFSKEHVMHSGLNDRLMKQYAKEYMKNTIQEL